MIANGQPTNILELKAILRADLCRYRNARGWKAGFRAYWRKPGFRFTFWMRLSAYLRRQPRLRFLYWPAEWLRQHYSIKYGLDIPQAAEIGPGLFLGHIGGIHVNEKAKLGANCNISQGVTIGQTNRGSRQGCPTIGDSVYIGPGAVLIGRIAVGSRAAVGANAVVTTDIEENGVAVGIPARVISKAGSEGYINWTENELPACP
jgi:serine O-acetyltransferase